MEIMGFTRHPRRLAAALRLAAVLAALVLVPRAAQAQDRTVGREALDPADQESLPPSIDGRTDSPEEVDPRALEEFREPLDPYGVWVEDSRYGTVWVPDAREVGRDFYPYSTGGHWELTSDADWLWVSDYSWGDIPFHYGRWVWIEGRGWAWIPGRVWAPAWVVWRTGPYGYLGWAPCPPTWTWWYGSATWLWWPPPAAYLFVETRYVFDRHVHHHVLRTPARAKHAAAQTRPQRAPARPGAPSYDRFRPASPDLDSIRYAGPAPTRSPMRTHPEVGLQGDRSPGRAGSAVIGRGDRAVGRDDRGMSRRPARPSAAGRPGFERRPSAAPSWDPGPSRQVDPRPAPGRGAPGPGPDLDRSRPAPAARPDLGRPDRGPRPEAAPSPPTPDAGPPPDVAPRRDSAPRSDSAPRHDAPRTSAPVGGAQRGPSIRPSAPSVAPAPARPVVRPGPAAAPRRGGRGR